MPSPGGEGGSRVPRKRETDEGLAASFGRGAAGGGGMFPAADSLFI